MLALVHLRPFLLWILRKFIHFNMFRFFIFFRYPPMGSNATHFPPTLFYPDFMKGTVQRREQSEAFQVVLTNEKGERCSKKPKFFEPNRFFRTFAFCLKFPVNYCCSFSNRKHCSLLSVDSGIGSTLPSTRGFIYAFDKNF